MNHGITGALPTATTVDNVMFFSLTSKKYDQVANNGAAYLQKRDPSTMSGGYQSAANVDYMVEQATAGGLSEQYETVKHPCRELVGGYRPYRVNRI